MTRFLIAFLIFASVLFGQDFRSIDGSGNHSTNVSWGQTETALLRIVGDAYADGASQPAGLGRSNPRTISNIVSSQSVAKLNAGAVTAFLWQWGQFVDHDIVLTEVFTDEPMPIGIPAGDPDFDPFATGTAAIEF